MKLNYFFSICSFCLLSIAGCNQNNDAHKVELELLKEEVESLKGTIDKHGFRIDMTEMGLSKNGLVVFNPDSKGYQIANSEIGNFPISIKQYPKKTNNYQTIIEIGNPYFYVLTDFEIEINAYFKSEPSSRMKSSKKSHIFNQRLYPGIWNEVTFNISSVEGNKIDHLFLSFIPNDMILKKNAK